MISVEEALRHIESCVEALPVEEIDLREAAGRVTTGDAVSALNLPPFRQSAMDGYAVRAADLQGASESNPVRLEVVGEIAAGRHASPAMASGDAIRIFTGGRLPEDADSVIRQERVRRDGDVIEVGREVARGKDVRPAGEELSRGERMVAAGARLDERTVTGLAMTGHRDVSVVRAPSVAVLITGDEVVPMGGEREGDELFDANGPFLSNWLRRRVAGGVELAYVPDEAEEVTRQLDDALGRHDLVVTTGGVSVGDHDYVIECAEGLGVERRFWKVAQKPGKPLYFGTRGAVPVLGLPGNPGAAMTSTTVFLQRILSQLEGLADPKPNFVPARAVDSIRRKPNRTQWIGGRLEVDGEGVRRFEPFLGHQGHRVGTLYRADVIARVGPGEADIEVGEAVGCVAVSDVGEFNASDS